MIVVVERDHLVRDHVLRRLERLHPRCGPPDEIVGRDPNDGLTETVAEVDLDLVGETAAKELPISGVGSHGVPELNVADVGAIQQTPQASLIDRCFM